MLYCVLQDSRLYVGSTQAVLRLSGQGSASSQPVTNTVSRYEEGAQAVLRLSGQESASSQPVTNTVRLYEQDTQDVLRLREEVAPRLLLTQCAFIRRALKLSCDSARRSQPERRVQASSLTSIPCGAMRRAGKLSCDSARRSLLGRDGQERLRGPKYGRSILVDSVVLRKTLTEVTHTWD